MARRGRKRRRGRSRRRGPFRRRRRRRRGARITFLRLRRPSVLPDTTFMKFKYYFEDTLADAVVGTATTSVRLNSPFEPIFGENPVLGWNQWEAFYDRYRCFGSSIKITFVNLSGANVAVRCTLWPFTENTFPAPLNNIVAQPYSRSRYIQGDLSGGAIKTIKHFMTVRKLQGRTSIDRDFTALTSANPAELFFWNIMCDAQIGTNLNVRTNIEMTFYCQMYKRLILPVQTAPVAALVLPATSANALSAVLPSL